MNCNLRCRYCYEFRQHGDVVSHADLPKEDAVKIVERIAQLFPKSEILWLFHGGEPLLNGIQYFESFANKLREVNQKYGVHYRLALQTNGTHLSEDWIKAFSANADVFSERIISVSVDGPEEFEGMVRINAAGKSAHEDIVAGINKIKDSDLDFTTISVVGRHNVNDPEKTYRFIQALNPNFAKFIPCYNLDSFGNTEHYGITPLEYASFMCDIFDLWMKDLPDKTDDRFVIDPILSITSKITGAPVTWCEYQPEKCDNFVSIYPDGDLWLCDAYDHRTMDKQSFVGNVFKLSDHELRTALETSEKVCAYQDFYQSLMQECQDCEVYSICSGGCLEKRHTLQQISQELHSEFCDGKKMLIGHIKDVVECALTCKDEAEVNA